MNLELLFAEFLRVRRLLKNISLNTERYYKQSFTAFKTYSSLDENLLLFSLIVIESITQFTSQFTRSNYVS